MALEVIVVPNSYEPDFLQNLEDINDSESSNLDYDYSVEAAA